MFETVSPGAPPDGTFSGDVNGLGVEVFDYAFEGSRRAEGQANFLIGGARQIGEHCRLYDIDGMAVIGENFSGGCERANDAVNLRVPSIGEDLNAHKASLIYTYCRRFLAP